MVTTGIMRHHHQCTNWLDATNQPYQVTDGITHQAKTTHIVNTLHILTTPEIFCHIFSKGDPDRQHLFVPLYLSQQFNDVFIVCTECKTGVNVNNDVSTIRIKVYKSTGVVS